MINKGAFLLKLFIFVFAVLSSSTVKADQSHIGTDIYAIEATLPAEHLALETNFNAVELSSRNYKSVEKSGFSNNDPDSDTSFDVIVYENYVYNGAYPKKADINHYIPYIAHGYINVTRQRGPPLFKIA